jgi:hypothetical protein
MEFSKMLRQRREELKLGIRETASHGRVIKHDPLTHAFAIIGQGIREAED